MVIRIRHSPVITEQVYSDVAGLRSSEEVRPTGQGLDQQGPWPSTNMAVIELETDTPTT